MKVPKITLNVDLNRKTAPQVATNGRRVSSAEPFDEIKPTDFKKKAHDFGSRSMNEYLLGSRKLKAFPVAMSLVAR